MNLRANVKTFVNMGKKGKPTATSVPSEAAGSESQAVSETEIRRKRQIRTAHRRSTERLMETANEILQSILENPSSVSQQRTAILHHRTTLNEKFELLQELNLEILELSTEEDIVEEIETADLFQNSVKFVIARLDAVFPAVSTPKMEPSTMSDEPTSENGQTETVSAQIASTHISTSSQSEAVSPRVKLPKLELKRFDGDVTKWCTFWDTFEASIHNNTSIATIDKFNYLISLLEKVASEAIACLSITTANYEEAIAILRGRFGNKQMIINKHMEGLLNMAPVTSNHDLRGLRRIYHLVEVHVRGLKALGVSSESYGNLLSSVLMNKIPQELRLIVSREIKQGDWELDPLLKALHQELEARERAMGATVSLPARRKDQYCNDPPTASALTSTSHPSPTCTYCKQPHASNKCKTVTDVQARREILRKNGRCYVCLKKYHLSRDCPSQNKCFKCNGRHHISICTSHTPLTPPSDKSQSKEGTNQRDKCSPESAPAVMFISSKTPILLQTAQAVINKTGSAGGGRKIRIILDSGSQRSYITNHLKKDLNLQVDHQETMLIKTFGSKEEKSQNCDVVHFSIKLLDGKDMQMSAYSVPLICEPLSGQTVDLAKNMYDFLSDLHLADYPREAGPAEVHILIGSDQYWQLVTGEVRRGDSGPMAVHTRLGWVLSGPVEDPTHDSDPSVNLVSSTHVLRCASEPTHPENDDLIGELKRFWDLESLGISSSEQSVYSQFINTITFRRGRYEVHLPWKDTHPLLPDNYETSLKRLKNLLNRLKEDPNVLLEYDAVIKEQIKSGIVEEVSKPECGEVGRVHYLPHHAVIRRDKETTRLRIVYDASCKSNGPSLNDCLYTGPAISQKILDIILRFRTNRKAFVGDIEKAFLNVAVAEEDRDVLRFLWVDDIKKESPEVIVWRFARVIFGVSSSPFLLNATVKHHMERYEEDDPEFVKTFLRSIYVDDLSMGGDTDEEAYQVYIKSKLRLAEGGFNLRKFVTNSADLRNRIEENESRLHSGHPTLPTSKRNTSDEENPEVTAVNDNTRKLVFEDEQSYTKSTLGGIQGNDNPVQKILGVQWNLVEDQLKFDISTIAKQASESTPTKRNIASIAAKFYDPIGFLSPVVVQFKLLFQELCESKTDWDDTLEGELLTKWNKLVSSLQDVQPFCLERCYFKEPRDTVVHCNLHGFCDASLNAYSAIVYLEIKTTSQIYTRFVASKTRVAPLSKETIPRLELLGAVILARLISAVKEALECELPIKKITCWSDSEIVLCWIRNTDKEWKQFVQHRVTDIRRRIPVDCWRHCSTDSNPADIPSRGMNASQCFMLQVFFGAVVQSGKAITRTIQLRVAMPNTYLTSAWQKYL